MDYKVAFLGPEGTFSHEAASIVSDDLISFCTIPAVMECVKNNICQYGIVPIENSIEGPVGITLDSLAHKFDLNIVGEIIIPISHNLLVNPGVSLDEIEDVYSHAQALGQCQEFINKHNFQPHYSVSTAKAAKSILGNKNAAAVGTLKAAELYGLDVISKGIQDVDNNQTRFVILSLDKHEKTSDDKTSIVFSIYEDKSGQLYNILGIFSKNNINLTKIESRPSKQGLGSYVFFIDFEGHQDDKLIQNILKEIKNNTYFFKVLGSYPKFDSNNFLSKL